MKNAEYMTLRNNKQIEVNEVFIEVLNGIIPVIQKFDQKIIKRMFSL